MRKWILLYLGKTGFLYLNVEEHISDEKKKEGREYKINRRRGAKKKLEPNDQLIFEIEEFAKSTVRSKVEYVFGVVKRLFRMRRTRYRGLRKQQAKFNITFALANLYLADKKTCWLDEVRPAELKQVGYISFLVCIVRCCLRHYSKADPLKHHTHRPV